MQTSKKIRAFTLSELLVVIAITTIVVALAFSIFSLVQRNMHRLQGNFEQNTAAQMLHQSLWLDMNRYNRLNYDDKLNILYMKNELDSVKYQFTNEYIIKELDTFSLVLADKKLYLDGKEISRGTIDAISLSLSREYQNRKLFVFGKSDATIYINDQWPLK